MIGIKSTRLSSLRLLLPEMWLNRRSTFDEAADSSRHGVELQCFAATFDHAEVGLGHGFGDRQFLRFVEECDIAQPSMQLVDHVGAGQAVLVEQPLEAPSGRLESVFAAGQQVAMQFLWRGCRGGLVDEVASDIFAE